MNRVYLDHNSTTPLHPEVAQSISECYAAGFLNPASQHEDGRRARQALESARDQIAVALGAHTTSTAADRVVFTSGGTESNNLALTGLLTGLPSGSTASEPGQILVSAVEHPSIAATAGWLRQRGADVFNIPVDATGVVDLAALERRLERPTQLVSVMLGNNETGALQPLAEIVQMCRDLQPGAVVHTDAVQVAGKMPLSFRDLGVDALSISAHKFQGPRGIGALLLRNGVILQPLMHGGQQQLGSRPGTESVALAVGMSRALEMGAAAATEFVTRVGNLRDQLEQQLVAECPSLVVNSGGAARLPHTLNVSFPGLDRQALLMALDRAGVSCSTGSACASGSSQPSPVLIAMGCSSDVIEGSLRLSLGADTTAEEVAWAGIKIVEISRRLATFSS